MEFKIERVDFSAHGLHVEGFVFLPEDEGIASERRGLGALFTHGYTSHKGDVLNWAIRLASEGIASLIFDLPGHWLGSFTEVDSWANFEKNAFRLFEAAESELASRMSHPLKKILIGGHSLGALLAFQATEKLQFSGELVATIGVGLGISQKKTHLFETDVFRKTLAARSQLVASCLAPETVLPWISKSKKNIKFSEKRVHLIVGQDDAVVGEGGADALAQILKSQDNSVSVEKPRTLPHNRPEMAAAFIYSYIHKVLQL